MYIYSDSLPHISYSCTTDQQVCCYSDCLFTLLNSLAPVKTWTVSFTHSTLWFSPQLHQLKAKGRQLERLYKKTGLTIYKQMYQAHVVHYEDSLSAAKSHYYAGLISAGDGNTRALFSVVNNTLLPLDSFPLNFYSAEHCNSLMTFFNLKIAKIRQQRLDPSVIHAPPPVPQPLSNFKLPSVADISEIIGKSKTSAFQPDPLPTSLVKACLP